MSSSDDIREIDQQGNVKKGKRRFDKRDWDAMAEFICDTLSARENKRGDLEKQWEEIDRQVAMDPDIAYKTLKDGSPDTDRSWMAEMEVPWQAEALEVTVADARRMMIPGNAPWFSAHALLSDEYLDRVDFRALVAGDENEVPSQITQDNADKLVEGALADVHRRYDFPGHVDRINAEAVKYGNGLGRLRMVQRTTFRNEVKGWVRDTDRFPMLVPRSIKNTYLDDTMPYVMNEGYVVGPGTIWTKSQRYADVMLAASKGDTDPNNYETGGWLPDHLKYVEQDAEGNVQIIEWEGDLVIPRKTVRSVYLPNVVVTVAVGQAREQGQTGQVVRFRWNKMPFTSYIQFPYHWDCVNETYATGPLVKGRTLQIAGSDALNRLMDAAALRNAPPVTYDSDDMQFQAEGGPALEPYGQMGTTGEVTPLDIGVDPSAMFAVYSGLKAEYQDMTGVNPARLGAVTKSHTTAYAKGEEIARGAVRTVDYAEHAGVSAMVQFLNMEYRLLLDNAGSTPKPTYIPAYQGYAAINRDALPDMVTFEWFGAAGPAEEQAKSARRLQSAQLAIQIDAMSQQMGNPPTLDMPDLIEQILREGGWIDTDTIVRREGVVAGVETSPALPGAAGPAPATDVAALQAVQGGGGQAA